MKPKKRYNLISSIVTAQARLGRYGLFWATEHWWHLIIFDQKKWFFCVYFNLSIQVSRVMGDKTTRSLLLYFLRKADPLFFFFSDSSYFPNNNPWVGEGCMLGYHTVYWNCSSWQVHLLCILVFCGNIWIHNLASLGNLPINNDLRSYHRWFLNHKWALC